MGTLLNGIKEIFATSQSTATHLPVCASDGTPQGRISVGDLASVLGGMMPRNMSVNFDCNTIKETSLYVSTNDQIVASIINAPYTYTGGNAMLITYNLGKNFFVQFFVHYTSATVSTEKFVYVRNIAAKGAGSWGTYVADIPAFYKNYANLSSLASALGGVSKFISENQDFNNFKDQGCLYISGAGSITTTLSHRPSDLVEAFIMKCYQNTSGNTSTQIIVTTWEGLKIYKRSYDSGDWMSWQKVEGTGVGYAE